MKVISANFFQKKLRKKYNKKQIIQINKKSYFPQNKKIVAYLKIKVSSQ